MNKPYIHPNTPKKLISAFRRAKNRRGEGWKDHVLATRLEINVGYLHKLIKQGIEPPDDTAKGQAARLAMFLPRKRRVQRKPKIPQSQMPGQERDYFQTPARRSSILEKILKSLIQHAKTHPGKPFTSKLGHGLHICIRWVEPFFTLTISSENTRPSVREMQTCINLLPPSVEKPQIEEVRESDYNGRLSLRVDFPQAEYVQQMFE